MNHPGRPGSGTVANTYGIDPARRLVQIQVRKNVSTDEAVRFYTRVFSERTISPDSPSSSTGGGSADRHQQGPSAPSSISFARTRRRRAPAGWRSSRTRTPTKRLARGGNARRSLHVGRAARLRRPRGSRAVGLSRGRRASARRIEGSSSSDIFVGPERDHHELVDRARRAAGFLLRRCLYPHDVPLGSSLQFPRRRFENAREPRHGSYRNVSMLATESEHAGLIGALSPAESQVYGRSRRTAWLRRPGRGWSAPCVLVLRPAGQTV